MVTGGLLTHRIQHHEDADVRIGGVTSPRTNPVTAGPGLDVIRRYQPQLHLTSEQRIEVEKIFKEGQDRVGNCMKAVLPEIQEEVQKTLAEFRGVLTAKQQGQFDELLKQPQSFPGMGKRPSGRGEIPGRGEFSGRGNPGRTNGFRPPPWTNGFRPPWPPMTNGFPGSQGSNPFRLLSEPPAPES